MNLPDTLDRMIFTARKISAERKHLSEMSFTELSRYQEDAERLAADLVDIDAWIRSGKGLPTQWAIQLLAARPGFCHLCGQPNAEPHLPQCRKHPDNNQEH